jgi:hypothetical protein
MIIGTTNLVINEIGAVFNVRIEGDTDANLFYTDATNSRVGVGTISPAQKLDVAGSINLTGNVIVASGQGVDFAAAGGNVLTQYDEYTAPSAACTGAITTAVVWKATKVGNVVTLTLPTTTGTAVVTPGLFFRYGESLPTAFRPAASLGFLCGIKDNDTNSDVPGLILVASTGTITVYKNAATSSNFTAGTGCGISQSVGTSISWTI